MKNKKTIRITFIKDHGRNHEYFCNDILLLRHARNVGDIETVNHFVISVLNRYKSDIEYIEIN